jgi:hypothetical protein
MLRLQTTKARSQRAYSNRRGVAVSFIIDNPRRALSPGRACSARSGTFSTECDCVAIQRQSPPVSSVLVLCVHSNLMIVVTPGICGIPYPAVAVLVFRISAVTRSRCTMRRAVSPAQGDPCGSGSRRRSVGQQSPRRSTAEGQRAACGAACESAPPHRPRLGKRTHRDPKQTSTENGHNRSDAQPEANTT